MQAYRTEGNYRSAARLSAAELRAAMASHEILQATALAFDTQRQLRFDLGGVRAVMPFVQCADGAENGTVRDIAVLTRVGRPTCFVVQALDTDEDGQPFYRLSRAEAQRMCKADYLDALSPGDILPCTVTHIEPFGAFCEPHFLPRRPGERGAADFVRGQEPGRAGPLCAHHPGTAGHLGRERRPFFGG